MSDYDINLDVKYEPLTFIDLDAEASAVSPWFNQTLTKVNDSVVRLGVIEGDFHWHKHDVEDEFFLVLGAAADRHRGRGHGRARAAPGLHGPGGRRPPHAGPVRTAILMVEPAGVIPTGD